MGASPSGVAAALVTVVARAGGWEPPTDLRAARARPARALLALEVPAPLAGPALLGALYEVALQPDARAAGAHYTPADVARRLAALAVPAISTIPATPRSPGGVARRPARRVWDPACGGGAFLLAAADALVADGDAPSAVLADQLWGTDTDPGAVAVTEAALRWWAHRRGVTHPVGPGEHLAVADPLLQVVTRRAARHPVGVAAVGGFDVVLGNPPFQGQLSGGSVRPPEVTAALRERWGRAVVQPYTDTAALFLVAGAQALAPGGQLVMILPSSVLAARDAAAARAAAAEVAELTGLWVAGELVFGASVQVCAVVLRRPVGDGAIVDGAAPVGDGSVGDGLVDGGGGAVRRWRGRDLQVLPAATRGSVVGAGRSADGRGSWARYALAALGVPDPPARSSGHLGSIAVARAGFRDEYYGLVGHVAEAPPVDGDAGGGGADLPEGWSPLVTSGLVDPGRCAWGERPASFAKARYDRPAVDLASLAAGGGRAAAWVASLAVPKVVVATQTRVGEAAVDGTGRWVASTPTVAVVAAPDRLWEVAAVVCSPVGSIAALAATAGSARAGDAIRHRVATVVGLPLPVDAEAWRAGAEALRRLDREAFLAAMAAAYGLRPSAEVDEWWVARAPWPP